MNLIVHLNNDNIRVENINIQQLPVMDRVIMYQ